MNFTKEEHTENLNRLGIKHYSELIGKSVYYVKPSYGIHEVIGWDEDNNEYLLSLDKTKFWSNPFKIKIK